MVMKLLCAVREPTLVFASTSARAAISRSAAPTWPFSTATSRGVCPVCGRENKRGGQPGEMEPARA